MMRVSRGGVDVQEGGLRGPDEFGVKYAAYAKVRSLCAPHVGLKSRFLCAGGERAGAQPVVRGGLAGWWRWQGRGQGAVKHSMRRVAFCVQIDIALFSLRPLLTQATHLWCSHCAQV